MKSHINDKPVYILQDTGANIIIVCKDYVNDLLLIVVIKNLYDILSDADNLLVRWDNQEVLSYEGYVELENATPANEILVLFLITRERLHYPMLGTKAIKHISQNYQSNEQADLLKDCLPDKPKNVIESLVNFIHA